MKKPHRSFNQIILIFLIITILSPIAMAAGNEKVINIITKACQLLSAGEYDKTISACDEALKIDPNCVAAYYTRGFAYRYKEDYDQAIADFSQAINIDPKYAQAYYARGVAYAYKGNEDRAIEDFDKTVELKATMPEAYFDRARVFYNKQEYGKAWEDLHTAEQLGLNKDIVYKGFVKKLQEASGRTK